MKSLSVPIKEKRVTTTSILTSKMHESETAFFILFFESHRYHRAFGNSHRRFASTCVTRTVSGIKPELLPVSVGIGWLHPAFESRNPGTPRTATESCRLRNTFCPLHLSSTVRCRQHFATCKLAEVRASVIIRERSQPDTIDVWLRCIRIYSYVSRAEWFIIQPNFTLFPYEWSRVINIFPSLERFQMADQSFFITN